MSAHHCRLTGVLVGLSVLAASAAIRYVNIANPTPVAPYTSWDTAGTNIQDAVDAASAGDLILVTNGVYATGGTAVYGMSNRVAVTKPLTVQSVNGPEVTLIQGFGPIGSNAVRCVYLTNGAVLAGFTLTNGATQASGDYAKNQSGGGVWCESASAVVRDCVLTGNTAQNHGGGAYSGTLNHCILRGNSASGGGGASSSTLNNCALMGNNAASYGGAAAFGGLSSCSLTDNSAGNFGGGVVSAWLRGCTLTGNSSLGDGGGAWDSQLLNCIVYHNTARWNGNNYYATRLDYCCTTPLPLDGAKNLDAEPQLAGNWHLSADSPCRGAGNAAYFDTLDLDGEPWANPPSIGCDEYWSGSVTGALNAAIVVAYTNAAVGFAVDFRAVIEGEVNASRWDFGDGVVASNRPYASHAWLAPGSYVVELRAFNESHRSGVAASVTVQVMEPPVHYVSINSLTPTPPYLSWTTAATNIQDAVDATTVPGALVLVSNGVYATGATVMSGTSNRVAVTKPVTVQSVNGPSVTLIEGFGPNGSNAVRCVYLADGAKLAGFTLTNGATQTFGDNSTDRSGGGVWCESAMAVVTNCVLTGNSADRYGGGACSGLLINCTLNGNSAAAGAGAYSATLNNCSLTGNSAGSGGGTAYGTLNNCTVAGNSAYDSGGGSYYGTLNNCTVAGNSATGLYGAGGGTHSGTLNNCIVYYNAAPFSGSNFHRGIFRFCCTTPLPAGIGNRTNAPLFLDTNDWANVRLQDSSPCINAGSNAYAVGSTDLDGNPRIVGGLVDIGAYESPVVISLLAGPTDQTAVVGWTAAFSVTPVGMAPLNYYWQCNGTFIPGATNATYVTNGVQLSDSGSQFSCVVSNAFGTVVSSNAVLTVVVQPSHYVAQDGSNPQPPYLSWATAATNIQDAVEVALPGSLVLVGKGVYAAGATEVYGMSNRVAVTKPLMLQGVDGPAWTLIEGYGPNGANAVRCVYLTNGAMLAGFTLTSGATQTSGDMSRKRSGGGVWCEAPSVVVSNCVVTGNSAHQGGGAYSGTLVACTVTTNSAQYDGGGAFSSMLNNCIVMGNSASGLGGGVYSGTLYHCTLTGNSADRGGGASSSQLNHCGITGNSADEGGGTSYGQLNHCTLTGNSAPRGGGAYSGTLSNCALVGNSAQYSGGGAWNATLDQCLLTRNSAPSGGGAKGSTLNNCALTGNWADYGGGAFSGTLNNCALTGNWADYGGGAYYGTLNNCTLTGNWAWDTAGGAMESTLNNCIVYYNSASNRPNHHLAALSFCCTTPAPSTGFGNFPNAPLFVDTNKWSDLRLQSNSPCINAGNNAYVVGFTDLDGNPRISGGTVDIGAYEYQGPGSAISYAWLLQHGLLTDGSADFGDADADGLNNWQEWVTGTDPTNAASVFRIDLLPGPQRVIMVPTSLARRYTLLYCPDLSAPVWTPVPGQVALPGTGGPIALVDPTGTIPRFYRVSVSFP